MLEVDTPFTEFAVQIADLVGVVWPEYVGFGKDGITASDKWEVTSKEPDFSASPPRIKWILSSADTSVLTRNRFGRRTGRGIGSQWTNEASNQDIGEIHIVNGFDVTDGGGLFADISAGVISGMSLRYELEDLATVPLVATADNYIVADVVSGSLGVVSVTVGNPAPAIELTSIFVVNVTTNATNVTVIDETIAPTRALDGAKLTKDSVSAREITSPMEFSQNLTAGSGFNVTNKVKR